MFFSKYAFGRIGVAGVLVCGLLVLQSPAAAGDWSAVLSLKDGDGVSVTGPAKRSGILGLASGRSVFGSLQAVGEDSITVKGNSGDSTFSRSDVRAVYQVTAHQRTNRKIGIGFLCASIGITAFEVGLAVKTAHEANAPGETIKFNPIALILPVGTAVVAIAGLRGGRGKKIYSSE